MEPWLELYADVCFRRSADTAHDLKTPLNIAVLNLELLRMRVRKLTKSDDPKLDAYAKSIELELRKLARIFDAFFVYSVPPKGENSREQIDIVELVRDAAAQLQFSVALPEGTIHANMFRSRARDLVRLFCEGTLKILDRHKFTAEVTRDGQAAKFRFKGPLATEEVDVEKLFKFYYTDPSGASDLSLATARLIAETFGGSVVLNRDEVNLVNLELMLPAGER
jgi:hypothetical protein